jgi:hypothetical protein
LLHRPTFSNQYSVDSTGREVKVKLIKLVGLAAVAAIAATAFIGASSASATSTVICTENVLVCPVGKKVELSLVHFEALDGKLLIGGGLFVLCEKALLSGEVLMLAAPLPIHIHSLTYTKCNLTGVACEVTTTHLGLLHLLKTAPNLGELLDLENGGAYTSVHVTCGKSINCEYKGEGLIGHAVGQSGAALGRVSYSEQTVKKVGGILCPETSKLDAVFVDLTENLFISE